jgi:biotin carboxylase
MVGHSSVFIRLIDGQVDERSITVLEEPDLIERNHLRDLPDRFACVARVVPATYQQGGDFIEVAGKVDEEWGVEAVLPSLEYSVPAAAELADAMGLRGAGRRAAVVLANKLMLREATTRAGMPAPRWREVHGSDDIVAFAAGAGVVVKPADRQGSLGVQLLDTVTPSTAAQAFTAMQEIKEAGTPDRALRRRYMVEERLVGPEYSVEAVVCEGELVFSNVTDKTVLAGAYPVELGHVVPSLLPASDQQRLVGCMRDLIAATGFSTGILHAEWIWTADGPTLVECAGRSPGDHIVLLMDLAYQTSIRPALIQMHAGAMPDLPGSAARGSCIRFLRADPGTVVAVEGDADVAQWPGVHDHKVNVSAGDAVRDMHSSLDRLGYVIAVGADSREARDRADAAAGAIRIRTG